MLLSGIYQDPNSALAMSEELKPKIYGPLYRDGIGFSICEYFIGQTKDGFRMLVAVENKQDMAPKALAKKVFAGKTSRQKLINRKLISP